MSLASCLTSAHNRCMTSIHHASPHRLSKPHATLSAADHTIRKVAAWPAVGAISRPKWRLQAQGDTLRAGAQGHPRCPFSPPLNVAPVADRGLPSRASVVDVRTTWRSTTWTIASRYPWYSNPPVRPPPGARQRAIVSESSRSHLHHFGGYLGRPGISRIWLSHPLTMMGLWRSAG